MPAGEQVVRAELIGFATLERTVNVSVGGSLSLDIELEQAAVDMDEIIVTGTPGETERRAIGTSVASIEVEQELSTAPITSVNDLLTAREPGMVGLGSSGTVGTASSLTLRGMTSMSQNNQPLIYIDGVRLDTDDDALVYVGGQKTSRLNDVSPADIARVEVIKGAAATTLYGSEASNGVIQIFTKDGRTGEAAFNASARMGINRLPATWPKMHPDPQYPDPNEELIKNGMYQDYSLSVRGGADVLSYFVSGNYMNNEGSFPNNRFTRASGRLNLGLALGAFTLDFNSSIMHTGADLPVNDNVTNGVLTNIQLGNPVTQGTETDPWGGAFYPVPYALSLERTEDIYRWVGGVTIGHDWSQSFQQRLTVGMDLSNGEGIEIDPYAEGEYATTRELKGDKSVTRRSNVQTNIDYAATWTRPLSAAFESQFSVGGQLFTTTTRRITAFGDEFAAPGLITVDATRLPSVGESHVKYTTGGLFIQEQLAYDERLFLTGGLRVDGSSVFGDDFGLQPYPKVALSYVISDEAWFDLAPFSSLRLRAGYGTAGTQPGAFDAVRTYSPTTANHGQTAIQQGNPGNPDLAPEVSHEFEGGFEAGFFDERLSVTATLYHQTTNDALLDAPVAPSLGFAATQPRNIGALRNRGVELSANAALIERSGFSWSVNAVYSYNDNEITNLPGVDYIGIDRFGTRVVEGYSMSSKWEHVVEGTDEDGLPIASDTAVYLGPGVPPHNGGLSTEVLWGNLLFSANSQFAIGHVVSNLLRPYMYAGRTGEEYFRDLEEHGGDPEDPFMQAKHLKARCCYGDWYEVGDWLKLREVSVSYASPSGWFGGVLGEQPRFFLSGRNLLTLTGYTGVDPELSGADDSYGGQGHSVSSDYFTVPQQRQFLFGIDVSF